MDPAALTWKFHLGRVRVEVDPWFWLTTLMLGSRLPTPQLPLWVLVVFISVLVHELGHAFAAYRFGGTAWIKLHSFGGLTFPSREHKGWRSVALSLAGPFAGFALAGLIYGLARVLPLTSPTWHFFLGAMLWVNVGWGLVNLLPVPPLDGGHVLLELMGPRGERQARYAAIVVAAGVVALSLAWHSLYTALLFGFLGYQNYAALDRER